MTFAALTYASPNETNAALRSPPTGVGNFRTILIANRGVRLHLEIFDLQEIAIRIARTAHELGLRTVAIYSYEDRYSMHRYKADEAWQIAPEGKYTPVGAYLAMDDIIKLAKSRQVNVIHPGYGFLSENSEFARKCEEAGIAFVGPQHETIEMMGDKTSARTLAEKAGIPTVPGSDGPIKSVDQLKQFVAKYGLPIIIKAAKGGGGRGMRVVKEEKELASSFERAVSEALQAFGDGTVFVERFLIRPKHIEVQLLCDAQGNVIHLYERDCSVQRRHQKVVEMAPAATLPLAVRNALLEDALKLARVCKYRNAGTAEFLVDSHNRHYFIEVNPRIQVEHTVTEEITGLDIVALQIAIAGGSTFEQLGLSQELIRIRGNAIQCRITTEDPAHKFSPDSGKIEVYRSVGGNGVRLDGGAGYSGATITPYYDSLLVKVTCHGSSFEVARRKVLRALVEFRIRGVKTNIPFLVNLINHPKFVDGEIWTTFIDDSPELFDVKVSKNRAQKFLAYLADMIVNGSKIKGQTGPPGLLDHDPILPVLPPSYSSDISSKPLEPHQGGWRHILLTGGPEKFAQAVRVHKGTLMMDTTWRDAHQSILATRLRTIDMARVAPLTSHLFQNAFALEMWGGATFDVSLRFLHECPWERLSTLRKLCPNIPFQMLLRGANGVGYTSYPDNVIYEFCQKAKDCGVDIFRIFDSLNYVDNLALGIDAVKKAGGVVEATICYTGDVADASRKRYNMDYYIDLVDQLVKMGIHILGIKDMAGLLKPKAATLLVGDIRKKYPNLPIHVHTHDTAGNGVSSMIAAAEAGADVIDLAIDCMSGITSQPCMGAVVAALEGTANSFNIAQEHIQYLNSYWEQVRLLYRCFDPQVNSPSSEVYKHEMPGGQYTNLLFQATSLGLGDQWVHIKKAYALANKLCGDIVKVTPSSKVVGDFAQFIVANNLTEEDVLAKSDTLNFPTSVVEYFQGYLGIPPYGFPEPLRTKIVGNKTRIEGRPGKSLPSLDLVQYKKDLEKKYGSVSDYDVMSSVMYPKVFEEFAESRSSYGDLSMLPTRFFLHPLQMGQEVQISIEPGKTLIISCNAVGPGSLGHKDVFFVLNGESRVVCVTDESVKAGNSDKIRKKAGENDVGAPMSGTVVELRVSKGDAVAIGDTICVLSAMKMETVVGCSQGGIIDEIGVHVGDVLHPGDFICSIKKGEAQEK